MSRMKSSFAVLLLSAIVGIVPAAQAAPAIQVTIAGATVSWQTVALAAFQEAGAGAGHWTSASNVVNLTDTRVTPNNNDAGTLWVVWNAKATKVWSFTKADSVVGTRCYFAQPQCTVNATAANLGGSGSSQISTVFWGSDSALPASIVSIFTTGTPVTAAATVLRPEDAAFLTCRVNSALGAGSYGGAASDGLDGLGYNAVNTTPGACPANGLGANSGAYVGTPIKSGYPGSTSAANVLSFNIEGVDPVTGTTIPGYTVVNLGAAPLVFLTERNSGQLNSLTNASPDQLQQAFSGNNCDASAFGLPAGGINIFVNEGISGQGNVAEATVFRLPTVYTGSGSGAILGISQESNVASNNPLAGQAGTCLAGAGARYRAIGASEEVKAVQNSATKFGGKDGIGYNVFSYGNVSAIANNASYGYLQLNGVDPLFASYTGSEPGQPGNGELPGAQNLPAACDINGVPSFPCPEKNIWAGGLSYPNLRNGTYKAWTLLRFVSSGTALTATKALVTKSQAFVVTSVPDYVPAKKTIAGGITDPGLLYLRSHYQQYDGAGAFIGAAPVNSGTTEAGGDLGGCVIKSTGKTAKTTQSVNDITTCVTRP